MIGYMKTLIAIILILSIFNSGCIFTQKLWDKNDPDEYIKINYTQISEDELKQKNIKYIKDDNRHAYYVDKNSYQKLKDYTYRVLGTPVTIVLDTATIVIFAVSTAIVSGAIEYGKNKGEEAEYDRKFHLEQSFTK